MSSETTNNTTSSEGQSDAKSAAPAVELKFVPSITKQQLSHREAILYDEHRRKFVEWMRKYGKDTEREEGLAESTVSNYAHRLDKFYRWVWDSKGGFTTRMSHDDAESYVIGLIRDEIRDEDGESYSESHKRKTANAIEKLFEWRAEEKGDEQWRCNIGFKEKNHSQPDAFTKDERRRLREAALQYNSVPAYNDLSPEERDRWKGHIAEKLGIPKEEVVPADWEKLNRSWKIPSLVMVSLDAGLRPIEVKRSDISWLRLEKGVLIIPKEDSAKSDKAWEVALLDETVSALKRWKNQRSNHPEYDDTDALWLNRKGNPYTSDSLNYLLDNLCEEAEIDQTNRKICWYSIRHSVGTHMTEEGNLAQANEQLRHKSADTTMKYTSPSIDARTNTLNKME